LEAFKRQIAEKWGYAEVTTATKLVVYSDTLDEKAIIDYAANEIYLVTQNKQANRSILQNLIRATLNTPIQELASAAGILPEAIADPNLTIADSLGLLAGEVDRISAKIASFETETTGETARIKQTIMDLQQAESDILTKQPTQADNRYVKQLRRERENTTALLDETKKDPAASLAEVRKAQVPNRRWRRSEPYRTYVQEQSEKYQLPQQLIYAIIETESGFNPFAQSHVPAFGLMQIVPESAGTEVNYYLTGHSKPPSKEELFDPDTNVQFGTAYFSILYNDYFKEIKDVDSRLYCSIAAYNAGPSAVAKILTKDGSRSFSKAAEAVNTMSPNEVYQYLLRKLPARETRQYLPKVLAAREFFSNQI